MEPLKIAYYGIDRGMRRGTCYTTFRMILGIDASRSAVDYHTGVEVYSREIIRAVLRQLAHDAHPVFDRVVLYTPRPLSDDELGGRYPFVEQHLIRMKRLWTHIGLSLAMISHPPDVLFIPSHVLPLFHADRSVVTIHDVAFMREPRSYTRIQRAYLRFSTWLARREATRLIVPSAATRDDLKTFFHCPAKKIAVVPHGIDHLFAADGRTAHGTGVSAATDAAALEPFGLLPETPYIFYVGRLERKKNLVCMIEAFLSFQKKHPSWKLILAGTRGHGFDEIFQLVERHSAWGSIVMPGFVTDAERDMLYRHCRFVALLSRAEGFGFPLFEACQFGKPIVASDLPVFKEHLIHGVTFVDPDDVSAIAKAFATVATATAAAAEHARTAPTVALPAAVRDELTWNRCGDATLAVLTSVAQFNSAA